MASAWSGLNDGLGDGVGSTLVCRSEEDSIMPWCMCFLGVFVGVIIMALHSVHHLREQYEHIVHVGDVQSDGASCAVF